MLIYSKYIGDGDSIATVQQKQILGASGNKIKQPSLLKDRTIQEQARNRRNNLRPIQNKTLYRIYVI